MSEPSSPADKSEPPTTDEDQAIRERVRALTTLALQQGRIDSEGVKDVVRSVAGGAGAGAEIQTAEARQAFADAVKVLDEALMEAATSTHNALERLASRGKDFTDNDIKDALVSLRKLQDEYVAITNRIADATTGSLRDELIDLAVHAQNVGADVGSRAATMVSEFAGRMGNVYRENTTSGLGTARAYGVRMALLSSGILAGVGDALRDHSETKKAE
ncbi:MAG: DUF6781 family protein [Methyloligellaceae bacterium]